MDMLYWVFVIRVNYRNSYLYNYSKHLFLSSYKFFFSLVRVAFSYFFSNYLHIMADSEYRTGNYKSLKISIGTTIKDPEILRFVPDHRKTKRMCKHEVKKLPFIIRYVPDQYKTQQIYDKVFLENGGMPMFVADDYKNKKGVIKLLVI